jgi:hypothetical protein
VERIQHWAPVVGLWDVADTDHPIYQGPLQGSVRPYGMCVSDVRLSEGAVETTVSLPGGTNGASPSGTGRILFGYRSPADEYVFAGLGGWDFAYTIGRFDPTLGWQGLALAGSEANLRPEHPYRLVVRIRGQRIILEVDVRVLDHVLQPSIIEGQLGLFAWGNGPVRFSDVSYEAERGVAFVVMKFSEPYHDLYEDVSKKVVNEFNLRAHDVGEAFGPGIILDDIVQGIVEAKVVIADITPTNENVFYELGYAHALKKPTILLAEKGKILPFDISGYRVLFYENSIGGKRRLVEGLKKHLDAMLS